MKNNLLGNFRIRLLLILAVLCFCFVIFYWGIGEIYPLDSSVEIILDYLAILLMFFVAFMFFYIWFKEILPSINSYSEIEDSTLLEQLNHIQKPNNTIITPELMQRYFSRYLNIDIADIKKITFCLAQKEQDKYDKTILDYFYFVIVAETKNGYAYYNLSENILSKELKNGCRLETIKKENYEKQIYFHNKYVILMHNLEPFFIYRIKMINKH